MYAPKPFPTLQAESGLKLSKPCFPQQKTSGSGMWANTHTIPAFTRSLSKYLPRENTGQVCSLYTQGEEVSQQKQTRIYKHYARVTREKRQARPNKSVNTLTLLICGKLQNTSNFEIQTSSFELLYYKLTPQGEDTHKDYQEKDTVQIGLKAFKAV